MSKGTVLLLIVVGCILLVVANVALWATLDVFNAGRFGDHVAEGLQSEASAEALAGPIVDEIMVAYPEFPALLQEQAEEVVVWLLQRPAFTVVFKDAAAVANKVMTTSAEDVVGIDLAGVIEEAGSTVAGVISGIDPDAGAKVEAALDTAVNNSPRLDIYEEGRFPELRQLSNMAPWVAFLAGIGAIVLLVWAYLKAADQHEALKYSGWGIMITAVLGYLLIVPGVYGWAQANVINPTMQIVVSEVISVLIRGYAVQTLLLFMIGLIVLLYNHAKTNQNKQASASTGTSQAAPSA